MGLNLFTYSIMGHTGPRTGDTTKEAAELNQPQMSFCAAKHEGSKKGLSFVEIVSSCNSGWKMTPVQANKWMEENMFPNYPLGDIKVDGKIAEGIDVNRLVVSAPLTVKQ